MSVCALVKCACVFCLGFWGGVAWIVVCVLCDVCVCACVCACLYLYGLFVMFCVLLYDSLVCLCCGFVFFMVK